MTDDTNNGDITMQHRPIYSSVRPPPPLSFFSTPPSFDQWPEEEDVPGFQKTYLRYLSEVESLSFAFIGLVAEALGLGPDGLEQFYDARGTMQHRSKVRIYFCARYVHGKREGEGGDESIMALRGPRWDDCWTLIKPQRSP